MTVIDALSYGLVRWCYNMHLGYKGFDVFLAQQRCCQEEEYTAFEHGELAILDAEPLPVGMFHVAAALIVRIIYPGEVKFAFSQNLQ